MGQVTIYLDDETERRMREAAKSSGLSQSKWIAAAHREPDPRDLARGGGPAGRGVEGSALCRGAARGRL